MGVSERYPLALHTDMLARRTGQVDDANTEASGAGSVPGIIRGHDCVFPSFGTLGARPVRGKGRCIFPAAGERLLCIF